MYIGRICRNHLHTFVPSRITFCKVQRCHTKQMGAARHEAEQRKAHSQSQWHMR